VESGLNLLIDSTDLIDFLRGKPGSIELLQEAFRSADGVYASAMNVAEVYGGIRSCEEAKTHALLESLRCLPISFDIARHAGKLRTQFLRKGRTHSIQDMIVAATALEHGLTLVTQNRKDFPIEGLTFWP
jgi:tRNA(fMet)-specific endonuclease VapC